MKKIIFSLSVTMLFSVYSLYCQNIKAEKCFKVGNTYKKIGLITGSIGAASVVGGAVLSIIALQDIYYSNDYYLDPKYYIGSVLLTEGITTLATGIVFTTLGYKKLKKCERVYGMNISPQKITFTYRF